MSATRTEQRSTATSATGQPDLLPAAADCMKKLALVESEKASQRGRAGALVSPRAAR